MGEIYAHVNELKCPKLFFFGILEILAIVNPIVNFKVLALDQIKSYELNFFHSVFFTTQNNTKQVIEVAGTNVV